MIVIVLVLATLGLSAAANRRAANSYFKSQSLYTARSVGQSITGFLLKDDPQSPNAALRSEIANLSETNRGPLFLDVVFGAELAGLGQLGLPEAGTGIVDESKGISVTWVGKDEIGTKTFVSGSGKNIVKISVSAVFQGQQSFYENYILLHSVTANGSPGVVFNEQFSGSYNNINVYGPVSSVGDPSATQMLSMKNQGAAFSAGSVFSGSVCTDGGGSFSLTLGTSGDGDKTAEGVTVGGNYLNWQASDHVHFNSAFGLGDGDRAVLSGTGADYIRNYDQIPYFYVAGLAYIRGGSPETKTFGSVVSGKNCPVNIYAGTLNMKCGFGVVGDMYMYDYYHTTESQGVDGTFTVAPESVFEQGFDGNVYFQPMGTAVNDDGTFTDTAGTYTGTPGTVFVYEGFVSGEADVTEYRYTYTNWETGGFIPAGSYPDYGAGGYNVPGDPPGFVPYGAEKPAIYTDTANLVNYAAAEPDYIYKGDNYLGAEACEGNVLTWVADLVSGGGGIKTGGNIYCNGKLTVANGNGMTIDGDIYCRGDLTILGDVTVTGHIYHGGAYNAASGALNDASKHTLIDGGDFPAEMRLADAGGNFSDETEIKIHNGKNNYAYINIVKTAGKVKSSLELILEDGEREYRDYLAPDKVGAEAYAKFLDFTGVTTDGEFRNRFDAAEVGYRVSGNNSAQQNKMVITESCSLFGNWGSVPLSEEITVKTPPAGTLWIALINLNIAGNLNILVDNSDTTEVNGVHSGEVKFFVPAKNTPGQIGTAGSGGGVKSLTGAAFCTGNFRCAGSFNIVMSEYRNADSVSLSMFMDRPSEAYLQGVNGNPAWKYLPNVYFYMCGKPTEDDPAKPSFTVLNDFTITGNFLAPYALFNIMKGGTSLFGNNAVTYYSESGEVERPGQGTGIIAIGCLIISEFNGTGTNASNIYVVSRAPRGTDGGGETAWTEIKNSYAFGG